MMVDVSSLMNPGVDEVDERQESNLSIWCGWPVTCSFQPYVTTSLASSSSGLDIGEARADSCDRPR